MTSDQELRILITADSSEADRVLIAVEKRINQFVEAAKTALSSVMDKGPNGDTPTTVTVTVRDDEWKALKTELENLAANGFTIPVNLDLTSANAALDRLQERFASLNLSSASNGGAAPTQRRFTNEDDQVTLENLEDVLLRIIDDAEQAGASVTSALGQPDGIEREGEYAAIRERIARATRTLANEQERLNEMLNGEQENQEQQPAENTETLLDNLLQAHSISKRMDNGIWGILEGINQISKAISGVVKGLSIAFAVIKAISSILKTALKIITEIIKAVAKMYVGIAKVSATAVLGAMEALGKLTTVFGKLFAGITEKVTQLFVAPFKMVGKMVDGLWDRISHLWNRIKNMLSRVLIRKAVNALIQAVENGFDAMASKSDTTAKNLGQLKSAFSGVGASIASAFMPLINAATQAIMEFASAVVKALNAVAAFFGTLFNVSYSVVALTGDVDELGKSASGAGKKAKGALADFDELNVLTNNKSGGGGGGGADTTGFSVTDVIPGDTGSKLAQLFREGLFYEAGQYVNQWADSLFTDLMAKVDSWDGEAFGRKVATFINGVNYKPEAFYSFGQTLGAAIGNILNGIDGFLTVINAENMANAIIAFISGLNIVDNLHHLAETIKKFIVKECEFAQTLFGSEEFKGIGTKIANAINDTVNDPAFWSTLGLTIFRMVTSALSVAKDLVGRAEAKDLGNAVGKMVENLNLPEQGTALGETIQAFVLKGVELAASIITVDNMSAIGSAIANAINALFATDKDANKFTSLGMNIASCINSVIAGFDKFVSSIEFSKIGEEIAKAINGLIINADMSGLGESINNLILGAIHLLTGDGNGNGLLSTIEWDSIGKKIVDFIGAIDFTEIGSGLGEVFKDLLLGAVTAGAEALKDAASDDSAKGGILQGIVSFFDSITFTDDDIESFRQFGENLRKWFSEKLLPSVFKGGETNGNGEDTYGIGDAIAAIFNGINLSVEDLVTLVVTLVQVLTAVFIRAFDIVKPIVKSMFDVFDSTIDINASNFKILVDDASIQQAFATATGGLIDKLHDQLGDSFGKNEQATFYLNLYTNLQKGEDWDSAVFDAMTATFGDKWEQDETVKNIVLNFTVNADEGFDTSVYDQPFFHPEKKLYLFQNSIAEARRTIVDFQNSLKDPFLVQMKTDLQDPSGKSVDSLKSFLDSFMNIPGGGAGGSKTASYPVKVPFTIDIANPSTQSSMLIGLLQNKTNEIKANITANAKKGNSFDSKVYEIITTAKAIGSDVVRTFTAKTGNNSVTAATINNLTKAMGSFKELPTEMNRSVGVSLKTGKGKLTLDNLKSLATTLSGTDVTRKVNIDTNASSASASIKAANTAIKDFAKLKTSYKTTVTVARSKDGMSEDQLKSLRTTMDAISNKAATVTIKMDEQTKVTDIAAKLREFNQLSGKTINATATFTAKGTKSGSTLVQQLGLTGLSTSVSVSVSNLSSVIKSIKSGLNGIKCNLIGNGNTVQLQAKASGGLVDYGTMFIAGEAGPEVVANLGGGTSGVMNVRQMSSAVSVGVAQAMSSQNKILAEQNKLLYGLLQKELVISPSAELGQVMARSAVLYGNI